MTEENNPNNDEENLEGENWNPLTETREWSAAVTELACFALARTKGKDLVKVIDTKRGILQFICIFKDKEQ